MLGIFLLYFIWKYYSELAFEYDKNKWGFALLGIATYYIGTFIGGITIGIIGLIASIDFSETHNLLLNLMAMPFGLLAVWGLYKILESTWSKEPKKSNDDVIG